MNSAYEIKALIPHTWPLFFTRHGRFTEVQLQAIPPILDGRDTLLIAATAAGKTEAVMAPLLERYWAARQQPGLSLLYISPTRALVRDLYERLQPALAAGHISLAVKTGDSGTLNRQRPPAILITTPESTDSLLTRQPRLFAELQAIVLDEIHLFDNTPRGDHLRCLLARIERIRQHARPETAAAQRVALSATVPQPEGVARRYLQQGVVINVPGGREIVAEIRPLYDLVELTAALAQRSAQKSLIFGNSRDEVEQTAAYLRQHLPHHAEIFVHYSNLDATMRQEVEERFAAAAVAVCVTTSTLELGIDIGSVDDVVLLGAPYTLTSFLQRIGRGGRRTTRMRVLCLPKSPGEWARFDALLALARGEGEPASSEAEALAYGFRPSVLAQQIFSLMKQSPTGSVRRADVRRIAPPQVTSDAIDAILSHLTFAGYLRSGRLGEWRPAEKLQELIDRHEIHSNIGAELLAATAVDAYSGQTIAQTERLYDPGTVVLFGGRPMVVAWREQYRFGLAPAPGREVDEILRFPKSSAAVPFAVTQAVARSLGLQPGEMAILPADAGLWLFHFWGTVWGELLAAVLRAPAGGAEPVNEYCLRLWRSMDRLPPWDESLVHKTAQQMAVSLAGRLEMGRFHRLLPANVAAAAVVQQLNLARFGDTYRAATLVPAAEIGEKLHMLLG